MNREQAFGVDVLESDDKTAVKFSPAVRRIAFVVQGFVRPRGFLPFATVRVPWLPEQFFAWLETFEQLCSR